MNKLKFGLRVAGMAAVAGMLFLAGGGCSTVKDVSAEDLNKADAGTAGPGQRVTRYDSALETLGNMLQAYNTPVVRVQTLAINNATAGEGVPKDLAQLVSTALGKIQGPIKLIPYDPTYVFTEKELGKTLDRTFPDLLVKGAITEFDKDMLEKKFEAEADYELPNGRSSAGASHDRSSSGGQVALDLQVVAYQTQQIIPGVQTSSKIFVMKGENNTSLNLVIEGNGLGVKSGFAKKDGIHAALRLLVEVSVLELVGKYCDVPYWRCIEGAPANQKVVDAYRVGLEDDPNAVARLKLFAFCHGENIDLQHTDLSASEKEIVTRLKAKYNVTSDVDLITQLWLNVPIKEGAQRLKSYRRTMASLAAEAEKMAAAAPAPAKPASVSPASAGAAQAPAPAVTGSKAVPKKFGKLTDEEF
ncbi:MAG: hypothetical protein WCH86_05055 [Kiritimatiellales bacterium]